MKTRVTGHQNRSATVTGGLLEHWLERRTRVNARYSMRSMAIRLKVSPAYLSRVIRGERKLSPGRAIQFAHWMALDWTETERLVRAAIVDALPVADRSRAILENLIFQNKKLRYTTIDRERFSVLTRWQNIAVLELIQTAGFRVDPKWIARRLRISPQDAAVALETLKQSGVVNEAEGTLSKTDLRLSFSSSKISLEAIRQYHTQMISKSLETLASSSTKDFEKRSITGSTLSIDPVMLPKVFSMIDEFRSSLHEMLATGSSSEVYQLNIQFFNLSHTNEGKGFK